MKAIKVAVFVMSALLVIGFAVVAVTIVSRLLSDEPVLASSEKTSVKDAPAIPRPVFSGDRNPAVFGEQTLSIPAGCHLKAFEIRGQRAVLVLDGAAALCQQIRVHSLENGEELGRFLLQQTPE
ncbi:hypothetical protein [Kiloniella sp. b19]|uniref:hypothetical protein n=1 Tax=Kiloniella sp. GXU_MW_B19 TaxID=3141326 RepID=UPI0031E3642C